jgi:hypothetical protein
MVTLSGLLIPVLFLVFHHVLCNQAGPFQVLSMVLEHTGEMVAWSLLKEDSTDSAGVQEEVMQRFLHHRAQMHQALPLLFAAQ